MNEQEENAFRLVFTFFSEWRETVIETEEQWSAFAADVGELSAQIVDCRLGWHLMYAVLDTFNDLYRDGAKPMPANYFGREDL